MKSSALLLLFPLLTSLTAAAQEAKAPPPPPPLWSGKAQVSFVSTSGNTDTETIGGGLEVEYQPGVWTGKFKADYIRSETDGKTNAESLGLLLRGGRKLTARLEAFAQGLYFRNTFAGIEHRYAGEGGLAYELLPPGAHSLKAEGGLGYIKEARVTGGDRSFATARAGLLYKWKLSKTSEVSNETSYTAHLKDSKDWRFAEALSVSAGLTSIFSVKLSWALTKSNEPPPGFKKTDTITSAALVAKF